MKTGCIYKIENTVNGKVYIGLTIAPYKRWIQHRTLNSNSPAIHNAMKKYGTENFSFAVIEDNIPIDELQDREVYWINHYDSYHNGYNLTTGGDIINFSSPETRKKISDTVSGENHPFYGKHGKDNPNYGSKRSPESRAKMSEAHSGEKNHTYGKPRPPEVRQKISDTLKKRNAENRKSSPLQLYIEFE